MSAVTQLVSYKNDGGVRLFARLMIFYVLMHCGFEIRIIKVLNGMEL